MATDYYSVVKKPNYKLIVKEAAFLILQMLFSQVNLFGFINSLGIAFAFVRIISGANIFFVGVEYFLSRVFFFSKLKNLFIAIYEMVFLSLYYITKQLIKVKRQLLLCLSFLLISNALSLYYVLSSVTELVHFLMSLVMSLMYCAFLYRFNQTYKNKFIFYKFSNKDYLMFSTFILLLSFGIFSVGFVERYLGLFIISMVSILFVKVLPADKYYLLTGFLSIGAVVVTYNFFYIIFAFLLAVAVSQFRNLSKYFFAIAATLILTILLPIFKIFNIFTIFSLYFAIFIYLIIPNRLVEKAISMFEAAGQNLILGYAIENRSKSIENRLLLMSSTLSAMQKDFKFLLVGKIDRNKASEELSQDIITHCCGSCENFKTCFMGNMNKKAMFESLLKLSIDKGGIEKTDITNGLGAYCVKSGIVVSEINQISKQYLMYEKVIKSEDASKLVIANELENFADIFKNFAKIMGANLKINTRLSGVLKERFLSGMLDIKELLIAENDTGIGAVYIISSNELALKKEVAECIEKVTKNKMVIKEVKHLEFSGLSLSTYVPATKLRIDFAVNSKAKEQQNGDNAIVSKIADNKYFVAICDGMGHGEGANRISNMVISLIQSMFTVGLDDELILQSVNKLLLPAGLDNFTTLDACVIDLEHNECNFIKLGSSISIIKHTNTSEMVSCESLPIGIVQNIKPTIIKKQITAGDVVVLASDGVVDAFSSIQSYQSYINDSQVQNLDRYVSDIMFDAENQNNKHPDDMTVIAINLLKN